MSQGGRDHGIRAQREAYEEYAKTSYTKRYAGMNLRVRNALEEAAYRIIKEKKDVGLENGEDVPFSLEALDFGCGDGRYLPFFETCSNAVDIKTHLVGYDITQALLAAYEERLSVMGFKRDPEVGEGLHPIPDEKAQGGSYVASQFTKGNLTVTLVHGHPLDSKQHIQNTIGVKPELSMLLFGVLSHIPGRQERVDNLKMVSDITRGEVVLTVPNKVVGKPKLQGQYENFRKLLESDRMAEFPELQARVEQIVGLASEEGDIYYRRAGMEGKIYYHMYGLDELREDMLAAGLRPLPGAEEIEIGAAKLGREESITGRIEAMRMDAAIAKALKEAEDIEANARYFLASATGAARSMKLDALMGPPADIKQTWEDREKERDTRRANQGIDDAVPFHEHMEQKRKGGINEE